MNGRRRAAAVAALLPCAALAGAGGAHDRVGESAALEASQAAVGRTLGEHRFTTADGRTLELAALRGRPLVVSLVYTSCAHTCPMLTSHLAEVVGIAREALGEDSFTVLTLGFDAVNDTPARMASFARQRGVDAPRWHFVSTDPATVDAFTRELGFTFYPSAAGFDHLAQTSVVDAEGRVYAQVYGQDFAPPALVEPLKDLVFGRRAAAATFSGWLNGVRLFCTVYDPGTGRYRFDWSIFIALGTGLASLAAVAVFIVRAWREHGSSAAE